MPPHAMLRWLSWSLRDNTRRLETGFLIRVCRAKAVLVEGSSTSLREKGDLGLLPRRSTAQVTASKGNWWANSFLKNWGWVCSSRNQKIQ